MHMICACALDPSDSQQTEQQTHWLVAAGRDVVSLAG